MSLNPEEREESPRPQKRVCTGTPLVRCGGGLELKDEYAGKSLFICSFETYPQPIDIPTAKYQPQDFSYVVRSMKLADLLCSSSEKLESRQVANLVDEHLPDEAACGMLGSKIVFASGLKPNLGPDRDRQYGCPFGPDSSTDAYAFDVHDPNQGIVKMPGALNGGKQSPLTVEFNGKLYVLSYKEYNNYVSFEVFDPKQGTWSVLPKYPIHGSHYSYAIAGTKLFMSTQEHRPYFDKPDPSIWCFDLAAPDPQWRRIPGMCRGGPFPFTGRALVVDLPQLEHSNKKLLFSVKDECSYLKCLVVHLMSLDDENQGGDVSEIMEMKLPAAVLPQHLRECHLFHLGGNTVCLVTTRTKEPPGREYIDEVEHTVLGAAVLFQFQFDISKFHKDCFTGQFQPPRIFEYNISPDSTVPPRTLGCFVH